MSGAVFFVGIVAVAFILIAGVTPFLLIPVVVLVLAALFFIPVLTAGRERATGAGPSGRPTTREASYDPSGDATRHGTA